MSLPGLNSEGDASGIFTPKISLQKLVLDGLAYELQGAKEARATATMIRRMGTLRARAVEQRMTSSS